MAEKKMSFEEALARLEEIVGEMDSDFQKLKESNEPILYLAERYGFESQQTLTRTFKNYFDVPPHKYRMTNMHGESRYLHPINHCRMS